MEDFWPWWGLGACRAWGDISKPTWAKSVNGLIYYKHYRLYFTDSRGTIRLKWAGMFLFMYLFIWEEVMGTLGHYQLILLQGVFLWAEEIVSFDLLCKSVPCITTAGDHKRPRAKTSLGSKSAESCTSWCNFSFQRIIPVFLFVSPLCRRYYWCCGFFLALSTFPTKQKHLE